MQPRVRIGAVSYLNTRPLVEGLGRAAAPGPLEVTFDTPSVLADRMARGELDVALLPSIELARIPDMEIVPGLAIGVRGPARSVFLVSRSEPERVRRVALDPESRTSNALTQVLFAEAWGGTPEFVQGPVEFERASEDADGVVRIGDKALFEQVPDGWTAHDLGEAWYRRTGLPFVFAVWACRPRVLDRGLYVALHDARRRGTAAIDRIAREYSWQGHRDPVLAASYLRESIRYRLGGAEMRALKAFHAAAFRLGLIDAEPRLHLGMTRSTPCHDAAASLRAPR